MSAKQLVKMAMIGLVLFAVAVYIQITTRIRESTHEAVRVGDLSAVTRTLDADPSRLELRDRLGLTPLMYAAYVGQPRAAELLLDRGADRDALWDIAESGNRGWTSLHVTGVNGHVEVATLLIARGADVNAKTERGQTPLDIAIRNGNRALADLLVKAGGRSGAAPGS